MPNTDYCKTLFDYLESYLDLNELSLDSFTETFVQILKYNAINSIYAIDSAPHENDLSFEAHSLMDSVRNRAYLSELEGLGLAPEEIYVIVEKKTGSVFSNCGKLTCELLLYRDAIDMNSDELIHKDYLSRKYFLENKIY